MPSPFSLRDTVRLDQVHPDLVRRLAAVFTALVAAGTPIFVVMGVRTLQEQAALYAQGRTVPGPIVTFCDGVKHPSNHQPKSDGYGHAVDCAFLGTSPFADGEPWDAYGVAAEAQGLIWGGRWHMADRPHVELP